MQNEIIVNAEVGETRVALLERSEFVELHIERDRGRSVVGSVIKGRVSRVLPGMQAAFVDVGLEKAAFLYVGDYFANSTDPDFDEKSSPRRPRRGRSNQRAIPRIESVLREGQEIVVQVAKEPIGSKGARITSNISIPGRHLVLTPWARRVGVSRRIDSDRERRRLREIVERLRTSDVGFIIRTAGENVREADIEADVRYLTTVWNQIQERNSSGDAPAVLYAEPDLPLRMIRDFANPETKRITIDSAQVHENIKDFVDLFVADPKPKIEHYRGNNPIFDHFSLEAPIQANLERKVWLKSGGHLVVDQSEALTAIDVNTGRYIGKRDLEETVFRTNLEAVKEVVYQLRFRNIGGLIIIDLIDMESADNREKVYRALQDALRQDKARTNILKISELGLVEMTRKRTRENLVQTLCEPCPHCEGRGYILSRESVAFRVLREIRKDLPRFCGRRIAITVSPHVAEGLLSGDNGSLVELGEALGREIEVRARPGLHQEQFEVTALDEGDPVDIPLRWLKEKRAEAEEVAEEAHAAGEEEESTAGDAEFRIGAVQTELTTEEPEAETPMEAAEAPEPVAPSRIDVALQIEVGSAQELEPDEQGAADEAVTAPQEPGEPLGDSGSTERPLEAATVDPTPSEALTGAPDDSEPKSPQTIDEEAESRILPPSE